VFPLVEAPFCAKGVLGEYVGLVAEFAANMFLCDVTEFEGLNEEKILLEFGGSGAEG